MPTTAARRRAVGSLGARKSQLIGNLGHQALENEWVGSLFTSLLVWTWKIVEQENRCHKPSLNLMGYKRQIEATYLTFIHPVIPALYKFDLQGPCIRARRMENGEPLVICVHLRSWWQNVPISTSNPGYLILRISINMNQFHYSCATCCCHFQWKNRNQKNLFKIVALLLEEQLLIIRFQFDTLKCQYWYLWSIVKVFRCDTG